MMKTGQLAQEQEYTCLIDTMNVPIFGVDTLGQVNVWNKVSSTTDTSSLFWFCYWKNCSDMNALIITIFSLSNMIVCNTFDWVQYRRSHGSFTCPTIYHLSSLWSRRMGVRIKVLLNVTTWRDKQGNVIGVVDIGQDITAWLAQEREYSKLVDTANAAIFGVDTQGVCWTLFLMYYSLYSNVLLIVHWSVAPFCIVCQCVD